MGRWNTRRTRSLLLIAVAAAVFGGAFCVKDPTPVLSARGGLSSEGDATASSVAVRQAPQAPPRALGGDLLTREGGPASAEDLRDAIGASPPLKAAGFNPAPGTAQAGRNAFAGRASSPASEQRRRPAAARPEAGPRASVGPGAPGAKRGDKPHVARAPDYFSSPGWHGWSREKSPKGYGRAMRRLVARMETAARRVRGSFPERPGARSLRARLSSAAGKRPRRVAAEKRGRRPRTRKFRPALLSQLIGRKPLRPPADRIEPPAKNPWKTPMPRTLPGGAAIDPVSPSLAEAESITPPARETSSCRQEGAHWHAEGAALYFHDGRRWGRWGEQRWSWLERHEGGWWVWGGETEPPMLWHEDRWWWKSGGIWFLLHEGEPWGYRFFSDLKQDGFIHASGVRMVYSADGSRVGLITPGEGATVFDATTGQQVGHVNEDRMPRRPQPRAPVRLVLPD